MPFSVTIAVIAQPASVGLPLAGLLPRLPVLRSLKSALHLSFDGQTDRPGSRILDEG